MSLKQHQNTDTHPQQTTTQECSGVKHRLSSIASVESYRLSQTIPSCVQNKAFTVIHLQWKLIGKALSRVSLIYKAKTVFFVIL